MPLITDEQIDRLEQVAASATPGPWTPGKSPTETAETVGAYFADAYRANPDGPIHLVCVPVDDKTDMNETALFTAVTGNGPTSEENAYFIACARTAIPALIADLREARRLLERAVPCIVVAVENCPLEDEEMARNVLADIDAALGKERSDG